LHLKKDATATYYALFHQMLEFYFFMGKMMLFFLAPVILIVIAR